MKTHLQDTWKIQNKFTYSSTMYYNFLKNRQIKTFSWSLNSKLSKKLIEWVFREVEGYSRPEKHGESNQHN